MQDDDGTTLPHLQGAGARIRQAIAADAIRECRHIVEVGGAGLPITRFLRHVPESVTVIDPKITPWEAEMLNGRPCRVRHLAQKFQAGRLHVPDGGLAVVLLGLSLKPFGGEPAVTTALVDLCRRADLVVIEYPVTLARSQDQAPSLIDDATLREVMCVDLDIRDGVIEHTEHARRRLMVMRPRARAV